MATQKNDQVTRKKCSLLFKRTAILFLNNLFSHVLYPDHTFPFLLSFQFFPLIPYLPSIPSQFPFRKGQASQGQPPNMASHVAFRLGTSPLLRLDKANQYEEQGPKTWQKSQRRLLFLLLGIPPNTKLQNYHIYAEDLGQPSAGYLIVIGSVSASPYESRFVDFVGFLEEF